MNDILTPTQQMVAQMYNDEEGNPVILSPGQDYIFQNIFKKAHPRLHIMCHTRYGKSLTVGLAVLTRAATFPEKWAIVAGEKDKAKIIMDYVISHIFDNPFIKDRFIPDKGESWEEIRRNRNKDKLTFATDRTENGKTLLSEIFIGSAKAALGHGAPNVIEDEAALIPDNEHSFVVRMVGDNPHSNFMVKIGNPFQRNHFLQSYKDPKFRKVVVDCYASLKEGRITQETIEENRPYSFFKVLYECLFPSANAIDEQGYMNLLLETDIAKAMRREIEPVGRARLGIDVCKGGRNFNAYTVRGDNWAKLVHKDNEADSVKIAEKGIKIAQEYGVVPREIFVDDTGVGHGVVSVFRDKGWQVTAVNFGEAADKVRNQKGEMVPADILNQRAQCYAGPEGVQFWIRQGGYLVPNPGWMELTRIRYKKNVGGKTQIEPKEEMRKNGIESPDVADSLALTFAKPKAVVYTGTIDPATVAQQGLTSAYGGVPWDMQ